MNCPVDPQHAVEVHRWMLWRNTASMHGPWTCRGGANLRHTSLKMIHNRVEQPHNQAHLMCFLHPQVWLTDLRKLLDAATDGGEAAARIVR